MSAWGVETLRRVVGRIGHIQFAGVPARREPDEGDLDYRAVFAEIEELGWSFPLGAEYRPSRERVEASLGWMEALRNPAG